MGTMSSYVANIRSLVSGSVLAPLTMHALLVKLFSNLAHAVMMKTLYCVAKKEKVVRTYR